MSMETYEEMAGRIELYSKLQEGLADVEAGNTRPFADVMADLRHRRSADEIQHSCHPSRRARYGERLRLYRPCTEKSNCRRQAVGCGRRKIGALAEFPHKFEVVSDKLLSLWGIRFTIVMNYLAFYTVDDATQTVHIVRFLYGKSNWITILKTDAANGSLQMFS